MEYVLVLATLMLILGYVGYYVLSDLQRTLELTAAQDAVDSLAKAADTVYAMGPCSKTYVYVNIPNSAVGSSVSHKVIKLQVDTGGGVTDVLALTNGNVTGYLPYAGRGYKIPVELTCSGILLVGGGFSINPVEVRLNTTQGNSTSMELNLSNNRDIAITGITYNFSGEVSAWANVNDLASSLDSNAMDNFTVVFDVPAGTLTGTYSGTLAIRGSGEALVEVPVVLYVSGVSPTSSSSSSSSSAVSSSSSTSSSSSSQSTSSQSTTTVTSINSSSSSTSSSSSSSSSEATSSSESSSSSSSSSSRVSSSSSSRASTTSSSVSSSSSSSSRISSSSSSRASTSSSSSSRFSSSSGQSSSSSSSRISSSSSSSRVSTSVSSSSSSSSSSSIKSSSSSSSLISNGCNNYCMGLGYSSGICRRNSQQCSNNGEVWESDGDVYCTGGPSSDTCCCRP